MAIYKYTERDSAELFASIGGSGNAVVYVTDTIAEMNTGIATGDIPEGAIIFCKEDEGGGGSPYTLPTASEDIKGGIKIGAGLQMDGDVLSTTGAQYTLPTASSTVKGGIKVGNGLHMSGDVLSVISGGNISSEANIDVSSAFSIYTGLSSSISFSVKMDRYGKITFLRGTFKYTSGGIFAGGECPMLTINRTSEQYTKLCPLQGAEVFAGYASFESFDPYTTDHNIHMLPEVYVTSSGSISVYGYRGTFQSGGRIRFRISYINNYEE